MFVALQSAFWLSLLGLAYIYVGYPWIAWRLSRRGSIVSPPLAVSGSVSIVIVAHNEARTLPNKIASLLASNHAEWIREILIGSDGSTDDTATVLAGVGDARVRLIEFPERRGKPSVLNDLVPQCLSEVVVLADARQEFDPSCIERLVSHFDDSTVGVVSAELVLRSLSDGNATTAAAGIGFYWKYEKFIRRCESNGRGVPGATGACYAIRKSLFEPIPRETILDDVAIPMQAVARGYRCLFEPAAIVFDQPSQSTRREAIRKRRTIAGAAQLVRLFPRWLLPGHNPLWLEYVSHKLLRLVSPVLMVVVLATNIVLATNPFMATAPALPVVGVYQVLLLGQAVFYASALIGGLFQMTGGRSSLFGPPLMFVTLNLTTAAALWDAFRANYRVTWQKTA
jgi:poly-beta-1,6-N-acetyl-D-glucosamine synthase